MQQSRLIPSNEYRRERWRNGLGWTREIYAHPATIRPEQASAEAGTGQEWDWRLSIAEIDDDAAFSLFHGVDRELVLLSGNGLRLSFVDGECVALEPPHGRLRFSGDRAVTAELVDGRTVDFNLMWRPDRIEAELLHRPLVGQMVFFVEQTINWVIYLIAGQASFDRESGLPPMSAGDTALLSAPSGARYLLSGGGELLAIRVKHLQPVL